MGVGEGVGVRVDLTVASEVKEKQDKSIGGVLEEVLLGLIPENLFEAMANTSSDGGQISLYRDSAGSFLPRHEIGDAMSKDESLAIEKEVLETREAVVRNNMQGRTPLRSILVTPILYEGVIAGLIGLYSRNRHHFDINTVEFLNALSNLASVAIVNAQLYQDTMERERFYAALGRVTMAISATVDLPEVLTLVCLESLESLESKFRSITKSIECM